MAFKIKKIRPRFNGVITTATKYVGDQYADKGSLILDTRRQSGTLNLFQRVVSVGPMVHDIKEGDVVKLNLKRYKMANHAKGQLEDNVQHDDLQAEYSIPMIDLEGVTYLNIMDNDIDFVVTDYEVDDGGLLQ